MLNLDITRGPLPAEQNQEILREYNRLTGSRIPMGEFLNWVQNSPAGAAWHALLATDEGRIVGHTSLFPFTTQYSDGALTPAKSEYSFLHEDFRKEKIRGYEKATRATFVVLLDELFQHGQRVGWGPIFASTNEKNQAFTRRIGLQPAEYKVWECLFVLRPLNASRHTPNLTAGQRAGLVAIGISQRAFWMAGQMAFGRVNGVHPVPVIDGIHKLEHERIAFFEDEASLRWRYIDDQYIRFSVKKSTQSYLIAKKGAEDRYLRVCQWHLEPKDPVKSIVVGLLREANEGNALGVRWAVYENDEASVPNSETSEGYGVFVRTAPAHRHGTQEGPAVSFARSLEDERFAFQLRSVKTPRDPFCKRAVQLRWRDSSSLNARRWSICDYSGSKNEMPE